MALNFVNLFSHLGVEHLTRHVWLLLVGGWDEECFLKEAGVVSLEWHRAVRQHVLHTKLGQAWIQQISLERERRKLERARDNFIHELGDGAVGPRTILADAVINVIATEGGSWRTHVVDTPATDSVRMAMNSQMYDDVDALLSYVAMCKTFTRTEYFPIKLITWFGEIMSDSPPPQGRRSSRLETWRLLIKEVLTQNLN